MGRRALAQAEMASEGVLRDESRLAGGLPMPHHRIAAPDHVIAMLYGLPVKYHPDALEAVVGREAA